MQYDDATPFEPIKIACTVLDYNSIEGGYINITAIIIYSTQYSFGSKKESLII